MNPSPRQSIRDVPCIAVRIDGRRAVLTLDDTLTRAHQIERLDIRDPFAMAGMIRLLIGITALILRQSGTEHLDTIAEQGFDPFDIEDALALVDDHLGLTDSELPFLQCPELDHYDDGTAPRSPAATLSPRVPGRSSRAWFDVAGGPFTAAALDPRQAVEALAANWYYGCAVNSWTVIDGKKMYRVGGSVGMYGSGDPEGAKTALTFFHSGRTLAELLLANTHQHWVDDTTLPAWASPFSVSHPAGSLAEASFTGCAALLSVDEASGVFDTVITGGFPSGLTKQDHAKAVSEQLRQAAENDPTRAWMSKPGKGGTERKLLFSGLARTNSTAQNLRAWHVDAAGPELRHGLLRPGAGLVVLEVAAISKGGITPTTATWFDVESGFVDLDVVQRELVADIGNTAARNPERALERAVKAALPPVGNMDGRQETATRAAVGMFHSQLEPAIQDAVATIVAGGEPTSLLDKIHDAKTAAFDRAVLPHLNSRTVATIAAGRAQLRKPRWAIADDHDAAAVNRMMGRYLNDGSTSFRHELARGRHLENRDHLARMFTSDLRGAENPDAVMNAVTFAASHPKLIHSGRPLPAALRHHSDAIGDQLDGRSGIPHLVGILTETAGDAAMPLFERLVARLEQDRIHVSVIDLVHTVRRWHDPELRRDFAYTFFAPKART
ncbi:type I-E CRISPR-associated protein Cse1/CasA [Agromyces sp. NPDC057679]|uniref:type I-E CRISPR-associated protein Cse1/CasA n=1 Tax=Agromyces sp. NPDC057679 TaxID=3346207 RepID=UPI00366B3C8C